MRKPSEFAAKLYDPYSYHDQPSLETYNEIIAEAMREALQAGAVEIERQASTASGSYGGGLCGAAEIVSDMAAGIK